MKAALVLWVPEGRTPTRPSESRRNRNPAGGQSLLWSVRRAPAKSVQFTGVTGPIHVRGTHFLALFSFLTQRHQRQSTRDSGGSHVVTPASADTVRRAEMRTRGEHRGSLPGSTGCFPAKHLQPAPQAECVSENVLLGSHPVPSWSYVIFPRMYLSRTLDTANRKTAAVCVCLRRTLEASWHLDSNPMVLFLSSGTLTWGQNSFPRGRTAP